MIRRSNRPCRLCRALLLSLCVIVSLWAVAPAQAQSATQFTLQGELQINGAVSNATADFVFTLYDASTGGNVIGPAGGLSATSITLDNGRFTVLLDFGAAAFVSTSRWVQIAARSPAGTGTYTTLAPRQLVTPTPLAQYALNVPANLTPFTVALGNAVYTGGDVGIGTSVPLSKLDISGSDATLNGKNAAIELSNTATGGANWYVRAGATGTQTPPGGFSIADDNGYRFTIASNGDVTVPGHLGVGAAPLTSDFFQISATSGLAELLTSPIATGTILTLTNSSTSGRSWQIVSAGTSGVSGSPAGSLDFRPTTTGAPTLTLLATGYTGVGVVSPEQMLTVNQGLVLDQANAAAGPPANAAAVFNGLKFGTGSGEGIYSKRTATGNQNGLDFMTNFTSRLSISNTGNIGVNTAAPEQRLSIVGGLLVDQANVNNGTLGTGDGVAPVNGIKFGTPSGEGIASRRATGANQYGLDFYTAFANRLAITNGGNVGIGTTTPANRLSVVGIVQSTSGGLMYPDGTVQTSMANAVPGPMGPQGIQGPQGPSGPQGPPGGLSGIPNLEFFGSTGQSGGIFGLASTGGITWALDNVGGSPSHGEFDIMNPAGGTAIAMYASNDNPPLGTMILDNMVARDYISTVSLQANVKNFRVPYPNQPGKDIVYGCIEGPEIAMYVRGTAQLVNGRADILLPDHFVALADQDGITVQVTPLTKKSKGLAVTAKSLAGITVEELSDGTGSYSFDYEVKAVRKDHKDWQPVQPTDQVTANALAHAANPVHQ